MKLAVCAGLWDRHELALPWWRALDRLRRTWQAAGHTVELVVGGSEPAHAAHCRAFGGVWVQTPNRPLGRKLNTTVEAAFWRGADYLLITGADDFLAPAVVEAYLPAIAAGERYVGLRGIYFTELATGRTCLFRGYPSGHWRAGEPLGAGRLLHRSLLLDGRPWDDDRDKGLDRSMTNRLLLPRATLLDVGPAAVAIDVKTPANIWGFDKMAKHADPRVRVDPPELATLPEWAELRALRLAPAAA